MSRMCRIVRIGLSLFIFFLFVTFCATEMTPAASATTYYVATNGNDSYNGLSPSYQGGSDGPFRTLSHAANKVLPGDTVQIRGGTFKEASKWRTNGTEANPITITNFNSEAVVIDGDNFQIPGGPYGVLLEINGDWYNISNIEIHHSCWYGIVVDGEHCIVNNVYSRQNWGAGIIMTGSYGLIVNCRAWNNSLMNEFFKPHDPGTWASGIAVCRTPSYCTIRRCTVWDTWGQGIDVYEAYHITVEDCVAYNNQQNFYISDTKYILFQRNIAYCTPGNMIQGYVNQNNILMGDEKKTPPSSHNTVINNLCMGGERNLFVGRDVMENCLIANNTFVNASNTAGDESVCVSFHYGAYENARFMNNIILQEDGVDISELNATGVTFSNNNWSKTPRRGCQGTGDVIADPKLAKTGPTGPGSLTPMWFKILANSPAKDRAKVLNEVKRDFFKNLRGSTPDMGAIELPAGASQLTASATGSPTSGQAPLTVNFTGGATGGTSPYSYKWVFGDGSSSTNRNPSHTYQNSGNYTATLTVTDNTSATAKDSVNINVASSAPLSIDISASPTEGQAPLTIAFTGNVSGGISPYSYRWTFGDGGSSTNKNPSHTYSSVGTYSVTFKVTDSASNQASSSLTITVTSDMVIQTLLLSSFTGEPSPGNGGTTDPVPGNHSFPMGSSVSVKAIPNANFRFSLWSGDVLAAYAYDRQLTVIMDRDKSLSAYFCTKCGDADGNLNITAADAQAAFDIYLHRISDPPQCQLENADVDCNSTITPADALAIFKKFLGKGGLPGDCSEKSRAMAAGVISIKEEPSETLILLEDVQVNSEGYISVPIIIDNPTNIDAFGFDLAFPSDVLTYVTLESAEITQGFEQLDACVISSQTMNPADRGNRSLTTDRHILRVGGYKTDSDPNPSYGVLVTLVFKATEEFQRPVPLFIVAVYDDIRNASVIDGMILPRMNSPNREKERFRKSIKKDLLS